MKIAKKIVSMCLALAMIVTTFAVNTVDVKAAEERCTITLNNDYNNSTGNLSGTFSTKKEGDYKWVFCYNGQEGPYQVGGTEVSVDRDEAVPVYISMFLGGSYFNGISQGGDAQITIKVYANGEVVATSNAVTVNLAGECLQVPNLRIEGNNVKWDALDGAIKYKVKLQNGSSVILNTETTENSFDFTSYASEVNRIYVSACSADYSQKLDSTWASVNVSGSTTPSNPSNPSNPTPPTDDSNSSNDSGSSSESGSDVVTYAPTEADIYEQQMKEKEAKYKKVVTGADGKEVTSSISGVYEVNTMAGTAVKTAKTDVAKAVLTEDEIQNGTNTSIYMSNGLSKEVKDSLKNVASANGKTVLTMFMADMYKISKAGEVIKTNNLKENIEMVFGVPSYAVDANRTYSVLCVTPAGRTIEFKDMDNDPSTITLNANVLGNYAVVF